MVAVGVSGRNSRGSGRSWFSAVVAGVLVGVVVGEFGR